MLSIDLPETAYREKMRALARKGGAATRCRLAKDPNYYRNIGRLGGHASVIATRARISADLRAAALSPDPVELEPYQPLVSQVDEDSSSPEAISGLKGPPDLFAMSLDEFSAYLQGCYEPKQPK